MSIYRKMKKDLMQIFGFHHNDTGSAIVQIAIKELEIAFLSQHLALHPNDQSARYGLVRCIKVKQHQISSLEQNDPILLEETTDKLNHYIPKLIEKYFTQKESLILSCSKTGPENPSISLGVEPPKIIKEYSSAENISFGYILKVNKVGNQCQIKLNENNEVTYFKGLLIPEHLRKKSLKVILKIDNENSVKSMSLYRPEINEVKEAKIVENHIFNLFVLNNKADILRQKVYVTRKTIGVEEDLASLIDMLNNSFIKKSDFLHLLENTAQNSDSYIKTIVKLSKWITIVHKENNIELVNFLKENLCSIALSEQYVLIGHFIKYKAVYENADIVKILKTLIDFNGKNGFCSQHYRKIIKKISEISDKIRSIILAHKKESEDFELSVIPSFFYSVFSKEISDKNSQKKKKLDVFHDQLSRLSLKSPQIIMSMLRIIESSPLVDFVIIGEIFADASNLIDYSIKNNLRLKKRNIDLIFKNNSIFINKNRLTQDYLDMIKDLRSHESKDYILFYLIDLESLYLYSSTNPFSYLKGLAGKYNKNRHLVNEVFNVKIRKSDSDHDLRLLLDQLTNPKYTNFYRGDFLFQELLPFNVIKDVQQKIQKQGIVFNKFMGNFIDRSDLIKDALVISDFFLLFPHKDTKIKRQLEFIGEKIYDLTKNINDNKVFQKIIFIESNKVSLKNIFNSLDCCLFNNRSLFYDGCKMVINEEVHFAFMRGVYPDKKVEDLCSVILFDCEDKLGNQYLVIDGIIGSERLLHTVDLEWQKFLLESIVKMNSQRNRTLLFSCDFDKYREKVEHDFFEYIKTNFRICEKYTYIRLCQWKTGMICYNNTWSKNNELRTNLAGLARVVQFNMPA